jgi:hypothetical protein
MIITTMAKIIIQTILKIIKLSLYDLFVDINYTVRMSYYYLLNQKNRTGRTDRPDAVCDH